MSAATKAEVSPATSPLVASILLCLLEVGAVTSALNAKSDKLAPEPKVGLVAEEPPILLFFLL